jgi:hypothetical protein
MVVTMVVVAVMVARGSERRTGKRHQKQGRRKNLFHGRTLACPWRKSEEGRRCRTK